MSKSWPNVSLGELIRLERRKIQVDSDRKYQEIGIYCFGRGIFHKTPRTGMEVGEKDLYLIREGDLILQVTFAWEGAIALCSKTEDGLYGSTRYPTFRVKEDLCFAPFLARFLCTPSGLEQINRICPGSAGRNRVLNIKRIPEVKIPLPPLAEQQRVVARIDELSTKIVEAHSLRQKSFLETAALARSARNQAFGSRVQSNWVPLAHYVSEIENGKSPATEGRPATRDEWAVLKVGAVSQGFFDERENKALPPSFTPLPQFEVRSGDFIMSRANTPELVGACAVVRKTRTKLMLSDKTFRFIFHDHTPIDVLYLDHLMKAPVIREQIVAAASGTSPTMKNISKSKVLSLRIPLHSLNEQRQIVEQLDTLIEKIDTINALQTETTAILDALLPSILNKAFRGDL